MAAIGVGAALTHHYSEAGPLSPWRGVTVPPSPAAAGTGLHAGHCASPQLSACSGGPVSLWPVTPPKEPVGPVARSLRERLPGLMGPGRLHLGASDPGIAWGSCSPTQPSSRPPLVAGASGPPLSRLWASAGVGSAEWRRQHPAAPTRGVRRPPWQVQPPQRLQAAGGGHVPTDISAPDGAHPAHRVLPEPLPPAPLAQRLPEVHSPPAISWTEGCLRSEGLPPAPLLTLSPCGLAPPWGLPLAVTTGPACPEAVTGHSRAAGIPTLPPPQSRSAFAA